MGAVVAAGLVLMAAFTGKALDWGARADLALTEGALTAGDFLLRVGVLAVLEAAVLAPLTTVTATLIGDLTSALEAPLATAFLAGLAAALTGALTGGFTDDFAGAFDGVGLATATFTAFWTGAITLARAFLAAPLGTATFLSGTALALPLTDFAVNAVFAFLLEVFTSCLLAVLKGRPHPSPPAARG